MLFGVYAGIFFLQLVGDFNAQLFEPNPDPEEPEFPGLPGQYTPRARHHLDTYAYET